MTTRIIRDGGDILGLAKFLHTRKLPLTITIMAGAKRSDAQNRLIQKWNQEITGQRGDVTFEEVRACRFSGREVDARQDWSSPLPRHMKLPACLAMIHYHHRDILAAQSAHFPLGLDGFLRSLP